ncbi:mevalonate kinase [Candidatus Bathyarchaeota archaeon]|nr:mevalonate kinase [Candidatus Bathyarchaeota archaeon]
MKAYASAPGKVILTGEHFVVYGEPALVVALDRRVTVKASERSDVSIRVASDLGISGIFEGASFRAERGGTDSGRFLEPVRIAAEATLFKTGVKKGLNIEVQSDLPLGAGLGSSSATSVATVAAVDKLLDTRLNQGDIAELALAAERFVHVNPSGVDPAVSTHGGLILYKRGEGIKRLQMDTRLPLVIGNTGLTRSTGRLVSLVRERRDRLPDIVDPIIRLAGVLTTIAATALESGDLQKFGELMDLDQGLLAAIGVSNEALDHLIYAARNADALGAKLTGAGGGGCMIALCTGGTQARIADAIRGAGGAPITAETSESGVQAWLEN